MESNLVSNQNRKLLNSPHSLEQGEAQNRIIVEESRRKRIECGQKFVEKVRNFKKNLGAEDRTFLTFETKGINLSDYFLEESMDVKGEMSEQENIV